MSEATVLSERRGAVAHLTLNRPRAFNAMSPALMVEFRAAAAEIAADASVRAVVVTGAGKAFSAGGDLRAFADSDDVSGLLRTMTRDLHAGLVSLASMNAPVIAAVNGVAAGAGMSLAAACDLVVAAESATFTMAYTAAGLTPDGSSTWFLPRLIGLRRTQELMLTNRRLSAAEALDWQLVNQVVPDDQLGAEVEKLATRLACGATGAFGVVKKLLSASSNRELEAQLAAEAEGIASQAATPDGQEGIAAFLEKRKPEFSGS